jgi:hypothetical protein
LPTPFSPVQRARKFSAQIGVTSLYSSNVMRPAGLPPIEISKNTFGFDIFAALAPLSGAANEKKKTHTFLENASDNEEDGVDDG